MVKTLNIRRRRGAFATSGVLAALSLASAAAVAGSNMADGDDAGDHDSDEAHGLRATCDIGSVARSFASDRKVSVLLVKAFKKGDPIALSGTPATPPPPVASSDLCLVKLLVGPGHPGTAGAPSTSAGIGLEIWLPAIQNWNKRIRNLGGGGWAGGNQTSTTALGNVQGGVVAGTGFVSGTTDTGHTISGIGSFAMREDGGINKALWHDFAERSLHQLALKTKALTKAFYGTRQQYAYWDGCSTGGRQGYKIAQEHPEDYNGYLVGAPAFNWTRFITNELYPQIVVRRDLPTPLTGAKLNAVSAAATQACDVVNGQHLGIIPDPRQCHYDPTRDAAQLCNGVAGNGVTGTGTGAACLSLAEARAVNKIWYGQTYDGSVPDPLVDNGSDSHLQPNQLWWGLDRGSFLGLLAGNPNEPPFFGPFPIASDMVALELQDPTYATPSFTNATGNGANKWAQLTYAELANAYQRGIGLQDEFAHINTDDPDLRKARAHGAKIISYHGWSDVLIPPRGSLNYYSRVSQVMGGADRTNQFNRLYMVPGMGHCSGIGSIGPNVNANTVPLPAPDQFFNALVNWVEKDDAPQSLVLKSADASVSLPVCPYPQQPTYKGIGSITNASSYSCK